MPAADRSTHIGRHAGGRALVWSRKRVRHAAAGGLFMAASLFMANVMSGLLFHRDFSSSGDSLHAFISGLISYFIAALSVGLAVVCAAGIRTSLRRRWIKGRPEH